MKMKIKIARAINYAEEKHQGQMYGKDPYIIHPLEVLSVLLKVTKNTDILVAGVLHDVIEDCGVTKERLAQDFNNKVADIVSEVTKNKDGSFPIKTKEGMMVKLADTLCNISSNNRKSYLNKKIKWLGEQK